MGYLKAKFISISILVWVKNEPVLISISV